jgi:NAD(P)-dependent dehydrogenase (short-subunit alcohol dehydrogenase family)
MHMNYKEGMLRKGALQDKVILITGGGTGLGRSMGEYFLTLGARIIISSRKQDVLEKAASELHDKTGGEVLPLACDVRHYDQVKRLLDQSVAHFGEVDVVMNNAAGNFVSPTEHLSPNAFDAIIDIVLKGSKNVTLAFGKDWIDKGLKNKLFVNIVTTYAWTGSSFVVPSAMAKAGVLAMTRSLAVEWAKYGIRSNAIAPGPFPTKGAWSRLFPGDLQEKLDLVNQIPLRRAGEHQELANLAAYMVSDFAAFMNGEVVTLDGGEWLQDAGQLNFLDVLTPEHWELLAKLDKPKGS